MALRNLPVTRPTCLMSPKEGLSHLGSPLIRRCRPLKRGLCPSLQSVGAQSSGTEHDSLGKQEKLLPFACGDGAGCKTGLPSEENFQFGIKSGRIDSFPPYFPSQSEYILYINIFFLVISKGMILPDLFELSSIINTWLES